MLERLGPYRVLNKLGQGGMGHVYEAVDTRLDRAVAIKALDFGVAKPTQVLASNATMLATEPGVRVGTLSYMPPEQSRGEEVDHRADPHRRGTAARELVNRTF